MTADDRAADLDHILKREPDHELQAAWRWLFDRTEEYPPEAHTPPLARPTGPDKPKRIVTADLAVELDSAGAPVRFLALAVCEGDQVEAVPLAGQANPAAAFARALLSRPTRGALIVFPGAARWTHHLILRWWAGPLTELGYRLAPVVGGSEIRAIRVTRGKDAWTLCDMGSMCGVGDASSLLPLGAGAPGGTSNAPGLGVLHDRLCRLERLTAAHFATHLRPSVAGTGLTALKRSLAHDFAKFRPPALLVAMLRAGRGYRGGYSYARRFKGQVWQADITRAYAWAMGEALPQRWAFGRWEGVSREAGVWLCRVSGRGDYPVYVSKWDAGRGAFAPPANTYGGDFVTVLMGAELEGMRALGYHIWPGYGFAPLWTWRADRFVAQLAAAMAAHPRGSPEDGLAKAMAASVYGRFAMRPERDALCYSADPPPGGWYPYVTNEGEVIDGLWARPERVWTSAQHVDLAATIAGRVRGRVYSAMAAIQAAGGVVVSVDTDSLAATVDVVAALGGGGAEIGAWREVAHDVPATIAGRRLAQIGGRSIIAGVQGATPQAVEAAYRGDEISVGGKLLHLPWLHAQMETVITRAV